jgi:hypothetical protein
MHPYKEHTPILMFLAPLAIMEAREGRGRTEGGREAYTASIQRARAHFDVSRPSGNKHREREEGRKDGRTEGGRPRLHPYKEQALILMFLAPLAIMEAQGERGRTEGGRPTKSTRPF